ncbi:MAG: T9SS type A sorting domain-containing protein [Bacteroidetes bacterium]|nr:T9SS type A sorting domain-containing protein [Bacteroidota bacterium]
MKTCKLSLSVRDKLCTYLIAFFFTAIISLLSSQKASAQIDVTIDVLIGLESADNNEGGVVIAPNPFHTYAQIRYDDSLTLYTLRIVDPYGETLYNFDLIDESTFYVNLFPGRYYFLITTDKGLVTKQAILEE